MSELTANGFAVVEESGWINVTTVHESERGAQINWLWIAKGVFTLNSASESQIEETWQQFKGGAVVVPVQIVGKTQ